MTEAEGGPSIDITVALDVSDFPTVSIGVSHETKGHMDFKSAVQLTRGDKSITMNGLATTTVSHSVPIAAQKVFESISMYFNRPKTIS